MDKFRLELSNVLLSSPHIILLLIFHFIVYIKRWTNKDLSWNESKYGNVSLLHVDPNRVWTPDILLHNRYV